MFQAVIGPARGEVAMFKKTMLVVSILALPVFAGRAHAQIVGDLEADIPFQFHAGAAKLAPGKYANQMLANTDLPLMEISRADGSPWPLLFSIRDKSVLSSMGRRYLRAGSLGSPAWNWNGISA